jgi:hypothetical protein
MNTADLVDEALDRWATRAVEKSGDSDLQELHARYVSSGMPFAPSTKQRLAEALMALADIEVEKIGDVWVAYFSPHPAVYPREVGLGPTKAIAATRGFVHWQFGREVPE